MQGHTEEWKRTIWKPTFLPPSYEGSGEEDDDDKRDFEEEFTMMRRRGIDDLHLFGLFTRSFTQAQPDISFSTAAALSLASIPKHRVNPAIDAW